MNVEPPHEPTDAEQQSFRDLVDFEGCPDCSAEMTHEQVAEGIYSVTVRHDDGCPTLHRIQTSQPPESTTAPSRNPQTLAKFRALRLCVYRLTNDRAAAEQLDRELGIDHEGWDRMIMELVGFGWGALLAAHGVDLTEPDADWPGSACDQLEQELADEGDPTRRLALQFTAAFTESATHEVGRRMLADNPARPLALALVDLFVSRFAEPDRANLLAECRDGVAVTRRALGLPQ